MKFDRDLLSDLVTYLSLIVKKHILLSRK